MYYKLRCNSTQFVIYYKLRNYYKLQRNTAPSEIANKDTNYGKPKLTISDSADCIAFVIG